MAVLQRDDNNHIIQGGNYPIVVTKTITFDGGTGTGATGTTTLFNMSGTWSVQVFGTCTTDLTGASATISIGSHDTTDWYSSADTATNIDAGETLVNGASANPKIMSQSNMLIAHDSDITYTVATANITGGVMTFYVIARPLSEGATLTAA